MLLSWGFLIPCSIACSLFLRRTDESLVFFRVHYIVAGVGMMLAIAGWIISCRQFETLQSPGWSKAYAHGILGTIVMVTSILLILIYPCMGKPLDNRTISQKIVAALHTVFGYGIVLLAWITCYLGTRITWVYDAPFLTAFLGSLVAFLLVVTLLYKVQIQQRTTTSSQEEQQRLLPK